MMKDIQKSTAKMTDVVEAMAEFARPGRVADLLWFFKTGPGQYGEGDRFIGPTVPETRKIAARFRSLPLGEVEKLLQSPIHEHRLCALVIMTEQARRCKTRDELEAIARVFLANTDQVNNWDLVDASCHKILGPWLIDQPTTLLHKLATSGHLWEERIAMVTTYYFIKHGRPEVTIEIAEILLHHEHDLIHKAVGWMLREMGKVRPELLTDFLDRHAHHLPRTALRYALEKLDKSTRKYYMELKD